VFTLTEQGTQPGL